MRHSLGFWADVDDDSCCVNVRTTITAYDAENHGLAPGCSEHQRAEVFWVDGVDLTLSVMFAKSLSRWMEATGLEPFAF